MGANSSRTGAAILSDDDGKSIKIALQLSIWTPLKIHLDATIDALCFH